MQINTVWQRNSIWNYTHTHTCSHAMAAQTFILYA